jgi:hypothetical protein
MPGNRDDQQAPLIRKIHSIVLALTESRAEASRLAKGQR